MAISFFVDFRGPLADVSRVKIRIREGALRPAFVRIRADYQEIMRDVYGRQRTPGYRWPRNSPKYVRYDKLKGNNPPGVRTGAVRNAHTTGQGIGAVNRIQDESMTLGVGPPLQYANFSAVGPRRPFGRSGPTLDTFTQVRRGRDTVGRRVPVRDPLLAIYTPATRNIRKAVRQRWEGYMVDALGDAFTEQLGIRVSRPRRQRRRRRS